MTDCEKCHHYLQNMFLNKTVGYQEQVDLRRKFFKIYQEIVCAGSGTLLYTGSSAEGFAYEKQDVDQMSIIKTKLNILQTNMENEIASMEQETAGYDDTFKLVLEPQRSAPGFYLLRVIQLTPLEQFFLYTSETFRFCDCVMMDESNGQAYLSSSLLRDCMVRSTTSLGGEIHGPCATFVQKGCEIDVALCFPIKWPEEATEWIQRNRPNQWPPQSLVENIVSDNCHLVAKGSPDSPTEHLEWRLSFSSAELKLVQSLSHVQFQCYGYMKLYLKKFVNAYEILKDLLCSYFIKTCIFYAVENIDISWTTTNITGCFIECLKILISWVENENCPNYFIPSNNMFRGKVYGERRLLLLSLLTKSYTSWYENAMRRHLCSVGNLPSDGDIYSLNCHLILSTDKREKEAIIDFEFFKKVPFTSYKTSHDVHVLRYLLKVADMRDEFRDTAPEIDILCQAYSHFAQASATYLYYAVDLILEIYFDNQATYPMCNRATYPLLKFCKKLYEFAIASDFISSKLRLATLFYTLGQYDIAIRIIRSCTCRIPPFGYHNMDPETHKERYRNYVETMCGKNLTLTEKRRKALLLDMFILVKDKLYPDILKPDIEAHFLDSERSELCISSVLYGFFLLYLCNHSIGANQDRDQALLDLRRTILDEYFHTSYDMYMAYNMLGICLQISGYSREAVISYQTSLLLKPENNYASYRIEPVIAEFLQDEFNNI